jgi:hypothetical protein
MLASVKNSTERSTVSTTKMLVFDGSGHASDLGNASEQHQTQIPMAAMRERPDHACLVDLYNECHSAQCCCRTRDSFVTLKLKLVFQWRGANHGHRVSCYISIKLRPRMKETVTET